MKFLPILAFTLAAHGAFADDFAARAAAGRAASATAQGSAFDQSIKPMLGKAGDVCDPAGTVLPASELGVFNLVGDITPAGQLINVEVSPATPVAKCFATQLEHNTFNPPPRPEGNYPILVQLTVTN